MSTFSRTLHVRDLLLTFRRHWTLEGLADEVWSTVPEVEHDIQELIHAGVPIEWDEADTEERLYFISGDPYQAQRESGEPMVPLSIPLIEPPLEHLIETETTNVLDERPKGHRNRNRKALSALDSAIAERRIVRVTYEPRDSTQLITFDVEPVEWFSAAKLFYYRVLLLPSREPRTLTQWRIREAEVLGPQVKYSRRAQSKAFGRYAEFPEQVVVRFDKSLAEYIAERHWHPTQRMNVMPDGTLIWRAYLSGMQQFIGWVMSWGPRAKLLEPASWAEEVQQRLKTMAEQYLTEPSPDRRGPRAHSAPG